ncbi:hypothetical protein EDC01DRAFT_634227 [Geopyxis carbonaria]|nr:hypothetical protein EDC01DRAFT_634227 [Geopyxis carbonaria]
MDRVTTAVTTAVTWARDNPRNVAAVAVPLAIGVAPVIVIAPILGSLGFGAAGVAAGSTAAGLQSGIGGAVAAGSTFAFCQSAAAGGYAAAAIGAAGGVTTGVAAVGVAAKGWFRR